MVQADRQIIPGQLELHPIGLQRREVGSGQQILVYLDRPLHITPLAEQLADGDMGLDRFRVDFKGPDEGLDSLVRLLVEQVIESDEILLVDGAAVGCQHDADPDGDRKSTRLNSSHVRISYAVFCLKKKK